MHYVLQVDFPYAGPWGAEMVPAMESLAQSIAKESGLIWKIWTENAAENEAGGIYLFADKANAERYLALHSDRLKQAGIPYVNAKIFAVNEALSHIDGWSA
ncbi:monooxygenase [Paenalcaligenes sp. Me131]|uniref:monooxygenase n=1 Tax=Paenalcaligenes sp. Me131 TaxID=3392636 RepID=UPI003D2A14A3